MVRLRRRPTCRNSETLPAPPTIRPVAPRRVLAFLYLLSSSFRGASLATELMPASIVANPLDFPAQVNSGICPPPRGKGGGRGFVGLAGGAAFVDQESAVHFRCPRTADAQAPAACG